MKKNLLNKIRSWLLKIREAICAVIGVLFLPNQTDIQIAQMRMSTQKYYLPERGLK